MLSLNQIIICIQCILPNDLLIAFNVENENICFGRAGFIFRIGLCQFAKSKHRGNLIETPLINLKPYTKKITPQGIIKKYIYIIFICRVLRLLP
jgi:hypothetical protein